MMKRLFTCLAIVLTCNEAPVFAQQNSPSWIIKNPLEHKSFIENKGQFEVPEGNAAVLFAVDNGGGQIYFTQHGIVYSLTKTTVKKTEGENKTSGESEDEEERKAINVQHDELTMTWVGANPDVKIDAEEMTPDYFSYTVKTDKGDQNINYIKAYKKIIYKSLYPSIDVEYTFHAGTGIEYSLILHPGADVSVVKMQYSDGHQVSVANGDIHISTTFGDIIDHAPSTFYTLNNSNTIASQFTQQGNVISFIVGDYDHSSDVTVDPWTITPTFTTYNQIWNVQTDGGGNVYMYGGDSPVEVEKFSSTGTLIWTYNTPWTSANYWTGTLITDKTGNSFITAGSSAEMSEVNSAGALVWHKVPSSTDEYWHESFNCDQTQIIVGGTSIPSGDIFNINPATGAVTSTLKVGSMVGGNPNEARSICAAPNGNYYFLTLDSIGVINPSATSVIHKTNSGYNFSYRGPDYAISRGSSGNMGLNAMRATTNYLYTVNGANIDQRSIGSFAVLATAAIPGGSLTSSFGVNLPNNGGIDIDSCGNLYVGGIKKVTEFTPALGTVSSVAAPDTVYDIAVNNTGEVIAVGNGFAMSISFSACKPFAPICKPCTNPGVTKTSTDVTCNGGTSGSASVIASGGGPYYFSWSNGDTTASVSNLPAGVYTIAVTNAGGCTTTDTLLITQPKAVTIGITSAPSCTGNNGTATATVSGGVGPYTYNWTPSGGTNATATGLAPGSYTCTVKDKNGCSEIQTTTITSATGSSPTVTMTNTSTSCSGCNGTATATPSPAGSYSYIWNNSDTTPTINNLCPGTYTVTVTPKSGSTTAVFYTENFSSGGTGWTLNTKATTNGKHSNLWKIDNSNPLCNTGGYFLHIACSSSDLSFTCNPGATYDPGTPGFDKSRTDKYAYSPVISTVGKTNMVMTFTYQCNGGGSPVTDYGKVALYNGTTWTDLPTVYSGITSCTKATITIPAAYNGLTNFQFGFRWVNSDSGNGSDPPFAIDSIAISATTAVTGCPTTEAVTVSSGVGSLTLSTVPINATCGSNNGSANVTPSGGTAPYTYKWSNGATTSSVSGLAAGNYTVVVSSSGGCSDSTVVTIVSSGGPSATMTAVDPLCNGNTGTATATVSGGTSPYTYVWSSGQTTSSIAGVTGGTYTCTVTDKNGCITIDSVKVTQPAAIAANVTGTTAANCGSSNGSATVGASGGTGTLTYNWSPSGGTNATANSIAAGSYTCTITDANGCTKSVVASISNVGGPSVTTLSTSPKCNGGTGTAIANVSGGTSPYTYAWSPSGGTKDTATGLFAGSYTCTVTDKNGCITIDTVDVTQPTAISGTTSITNASCGSSNGSVTVTASGGTGALIYNWSPSGGVTPTATNLAAGTYTCTVTDANGCVGQVVAVISNIGAPSTTLSQINEQCFGDNTGTATVNASGGTAPYTYAWSPAGGTNASASGLAAGTYTCTVTDSKGCITIDTFDIVQPKALASTGATVPATCGKPGSATITPVGGTSPYTYSWSPSGGTNATASNLVAGTYTCTVTDVNGCKQLIVEAITGNSGPVVGISSDTTIEAGTTVTIAATGGGTYQWSPSTGVSCTTCPAPTVTPSKTTTYCVLVTDSTGCSDSACMTVNVDEPCGHIFVPNAFSPNGDHQNDLECVYGGCIESIQFSIYDRWGNKVFGTTNPAEVCWDGKYKGQLMNTGVFVYYLNAVLDNGDKISQKGNITLVR